MPPPFRKDEHVLSLDLYNRQPDLKIVLSTAEYYRLDTGLASKIAHEVCKMVERMEKTREKTGAVHTGMLRGRTSVLLRELIIANGHNQRLAAWPIHAAPNTPAESPSRFFRIGVARLS
jgi:hypothetical protein